MVEIRMPFIDTSWPRKLHVATGHWPGEQGPKRMRTFASSSLHNEMLLAGIALCRPPSTIGGLSAQGVVGSTQQFRRVLRSRRRGAVVSFHST